MKTADIQTTASEPVLWPTIRQTAVSVNFLCFGFVFALFAIRKWAWSINPQGEILFLLFGGAMGSILGRYFVDLSAEICDPEARDVFFISTFIYPAGVLTWVLASWREPTVLFLLPLLFLAVCRFAPNLLKSALYSPLELAVLGFAQILAMTLVFRGTDDFNTAFLLSFALWTACLFVIKLVSRSENLDPDFAVGLLQPVLILWFFNNLSNQTLIPLPGVSSFFHYAGMAAAAVLLALGWRLRRPDSPAWYRRPLAMVCLALFAASFLCDSQIVQVMQIRSPGGFDGHVWNHTRGVGSVYDNFKPIRDWTPVEGSIWQVLLSRLWFTYLDQSMLSYFIMFFVIGLLTQAASIWLLALTFTRVLKFELFVALFMSFILVIMNVPPLQMYYPYQYAWCVMERVGVLSLCCVAILVYLDNERQAIWNIPVKVFAFLLGFFHGVAYLYDLSTGVAGLIALFGIMIFNFKRIRHIPIILLGAFSTTIIYIYAFDITFADFFVHMPLGSLAVGTSTLHHGIAFSLIFTRSYILHNPQHAIPLIIIFTFTARAFHKRFRSSRFFVTGLYLFIASIVLLITKGAGFESVSKEFKLDIGPFEFGDGMLIPLAVITILSDIYVWASRINFHKPQVMKLSLGLFIALSGTDGLYETLNGGQFPETSYTKLVGEPRTSDIGNASWSVPSVAQYFYEKRNRAYITANTKIPEENLRLYLQPYHKSRELIDGSVSNEFNSMVERLYFYNTVYNPFAPGTPWDVWREGKNVNPR